jgi:hypothetical protein
MAAWRLLFGPKRATTPPSATAAEGENWPLDRVAAEAKTPTPGLSSTDQENASSSSPL